MDYEDSSCYGLVDKLDRKTNIAWQDNHIYCFLQKRSAL